MAERIKCLELQHINLVTRDFSDTVAHFRDLFGAQFVLDIPAPQWHAALIHFGGVLFELFVPEQFLINARYGPHYVGLEYQIADVDFARTQFRERGIRIIRDIDIAIHTEPADSLGVAFEFYGYSFYNDDPVEWLEPLKPADYWANQHPLGYLGLKRYSVAVADHEAALAFYDTVFDIEVLYEQPLPSIGARATGIQLANSVVELLSPVDDGTIKQHLNRYGDGIRSVVFRLRDLDQATRHFAQHGITLVPGDHPDSLAIRPEDNRGIMMEFSE